MKSVIKNIEELLRLADSKEDEKAAEIALAAASEAVESVLPDRVVKRCVSLKGSRLLVEGVYESIEVDLSHYDKIWIFGCGKASGLMASALESLLGDRVTGGIVLVLKGTETRIQARNVDVIGAGHPLPDEESIKGAEAIVNQLKELGRRDLVLFLVSGGGSALMTLPREGITLEDIVEATGQLLRAGADIYEVNAVRKHLSAVKGGWLARYAYPATMISMIVSDVVGDRLDTIASGPTAPDETTFRDAIEVLRRYRLLDKVSSRVKDILETGARGAIPETPKPGDPVFKRVKNIVVCNNASALEAAAKAAERRGIRAVVLGSRIEGEAREVGKVLAAIGKAVAYENTPASPPALVIAGGETTVTVRGEGKGGRNQELTLSASLKMRGERGIALCSIGTDGIDGNTDAAGAIAFGSTADRGMLAGADPWEALDRNDSYGFFSRVGGLIFTGPTLTNVNDIMLVSVSRNAFN